MAYYSERIKFIEASFLNLRLETLKRTVSIYLKVS